MKNNDAANDNNQIKKILFYSNNDNNITISVRFHNGTFWLSQKNIAELFGVYVPAVSKHLKNIFETGELSEDSVVSILETTAADNKKYLTKFYRLEAILAVGYRINSSQATEFRKWATHTLNDFIIKGFVIDDRRLSSGKNFDKDYFDELLEKIREIRASERRFYQKITDLYSLSVDYNKESQQTKEFFSAVQNKLHWAITGRTAAEIIYNEADATKIYMGLTNWKDSPNGKIYKSDVTIAKNYLSHQHISELNRIVSAYLDLAENNAQRGIVFNMSQWSLYIDKFLELSSYPILKDKGKVSMLEAKLKAETEYDKYRIIQDQVFESDFDREIKGLK